MTQSAAMLDFFVLEASDYLERLDVVAQAPAGGAPAGEEFVRLARAFRGSALMANQRVMARAAQGLESIARAVRDGRVAWEERVRSEVVRAVDDCQILLRRVRSPEAGDEQRAESIGAGLELLAGRTSAPTHRALAEGLDAGGRAFVAREAAAIASTLDRVARALERDPQSRDALGGLAGAMSQLRGVAILNDLPPLADMLAAVDGAAKLARGRGPVPPAVAEVFDAAAKAVARAAREVVDAGRPAAESAEARAFGAALLRTFVTVGDPVPVELLGPLDAGPHIVTQGTPPGAGSPPSRVELVSQGEFLAAAATELGRAGNDVVRDLRLFVIGANLNPLIETNGSALGRSLAAFAEAGWWAIGTGSAAAEPERFAEVVSDAAATLRSAETGDEGRLGQLLHAHASRLLLRLPYPIPTPRPAPLAPAPAAPAPAPAPVAPPASATAIAPPPAAAPAPDAVPAAADAADTADNALAASWATYEALVAEHGLAHGGLAELLGVEAAAAAPDQAAAPRRTVPSRIHAPEPVPFVAAPAPAAPIPAPAPTPAAEPAELPIVPIEALAPCAPAVVPIEALAPSEPVVVPIESLLYDGDSARLRLREVRDELDAALASSGTDPRIRGLLGEVFDLLDVGFGAAR